MIHINKKLATAMAILLAAQQIPVLTLSAFAAEGTVERQGGLTASIQWAIVNDNGTKILRLWGTGAIPNQPKGEQPWAAYSADCTKLEIGEGITSLGENAFRGSISNVTDISLPNSVNAIGGSAFDGCIAAELYIGPNVTSLGGGYVNAFQGMFNLENFSVDPANTKFKSVDGVIYSKDDKYLVAYPHERKDTSYTIPASCTTVAFAAFWYNPYLQSVSGANIATVGNYGFKDCTALKSFDFPKLLSIGQYAFYNCTSLENALLTSSLNYYSYGNCTSLREIVMSSSLTLTVFDYVFSGNRSTDPITITVQHDLYDETCLTALVNLFFNVTTIKGHVDSSSERVAANKSLTFIEIPYTSTSGQIGDNVYYNFDLATKVLTLSGSGATWDYSLGESPLSQFGEYSEIIINEGITRIGNCVLTDVRFTSSGSIFKFPDTLETSGTLNARALYNCGSFILSKNLIDMDCMPYAYTTKPEIVVPDDALHYHTVDGMVIHTSGSTQSMITTNSTLPDSIIVPEGVTQIQSTAFYLIDVKSIQFPSTLKGIYASGIDLMSQCETLDFSRCTNLTAINSNNFRNMIKLKRLDLSNTKLSAVNPSSITGCTELEVLKLPGTVKSISVDMLSGCNNIKELWCPSTATLRTGKIPCVVFAKPGSAFWRNMETANNALLDYDAGLAGTYKYSNDLKQAVSYNSTTKTLYITGTGTVDLSQFIPTIEAANGGTLDISQVEISKTVTDVTNCTGVTSTKIFVYSQTGTYTALVTQPGVTVFGFRNAAIDTYCTSNGITFYPLQSCGDGVFWYVEDDTLFLVGSGTVDAYTAGNAPWSAGYSDSQLKHISVSGGVLDIPASTLGILPYSSEILGVVSRAVEGGLAEKIIASGHHYVNIANAVEYSESAGFSVEEGNTWWSLEKDAVDSSKYCLYLQKRLTTNQLQGINTLSGDSESAYALTGADVIQINSLPVTEYSVDFTDGFTAIDDFGLYMLRGLAGAVSGISVFGNSALESTGISEVDWAPVTEIGNSSFAHTKIQEVILNNVTSVGSKAFEKDSTKPVEEPPLTTIVSSSNSTVYASDAFVNAIDANTKIYDINYKGALATNIAALDVTKQVYTRNATITPVNPDVPLTAHTTTTLQWYYSGEDSSNVVISYNGTPLAVTDTGAADDKRGYILETDITPVTSGTVSVVCSASSDNYVFASDEQIVTFNSGKATPTLESISTTEITYRQPLSASTITGVMKYNGVVVAGTFEWKEPDTIPPATTASSAGYTVVFKPTVTDDYNEVELQNVSVTVNKATPVLSNLSATAIKYTQSLADSVITGTATYDGVEVQGQFSWVSSAITPEVRDSNTTSYAVKFVPTDLDNYNGQTGTVVLTVDKADVPITQAILSSVSATDICYFDTLADSVLTGDIPAGVPGSYSWVNIDIAPAVFDSDITEYEVVFEPDDSSNYNTYTGIKVKVHVDPYQVVLDDADIAQVTATPLTYEQTLSESILSGPTVYNGNGDEIPGEYVWTSPSTVPVVGSGNTSAYSVKFVPTDTDNVLESREFPVSITVNKTDMPTLPDRYKNTLSTTGIVYGQTLADSVISGDKPFPGKYVWVTTSLVPTVSDSETIGYAVKFVPDDIANYPTIDCGTLTLTVEPYTVTLSDAQKNAVTATGITFGDTLASSVLSGDTLVNLHGDAIAGNYVWVDPTIAPVATKNTQDVFSVKFVPTDLVNYKESAVFNIPLAVAKRSLDELPEEYQASLVASAITFGQSLNGSVISGDKPWNGKYVWKTPTIKPDILDSDTTKYLIDFIPADADNYAVITDIELVVKVDPYKVVLSDTEKESVTATGIVYEQSLKSSALTGSAVFGLGGESISGVYKWVDETITPNAGTSKAMVQFIPTDSMRYLPSDPFEVSLAVSKKQDITLPEEIIATLTATPIVFGQSLVNSVITGDVPRAGHYEWMEPTTIPDITDSGVTKYAVKFVPDDSSNYEVITGGEVTVIITPYKVTLTDQEKQSVNATDLTQGQTLAASVLTGPVLKDLNGTVIEGKYVWVQSDIRPAVGTAKYSVCFEPTDTTHYKTSDAFEVSVTTKRKGTGPSRPIRPDYPDNPIDPTDPTEPDNPDTPDTPSEEFAITATELVYGQTLASSTLNGKAPYTGHFEWENPAIMPSVADSGKTEYKVKFVPDDATHSTVTGLKVCVTVNPFVIHLADKTAHGNADKGTVAGDYRIECELPVDFNGKIILGTWQWIDPTLEFNDAGKYTTKITFVPEDVVNFTVQGEGTAIVTVTEGDVTAEPVDPSDIAATAEDLMVSQKLSDSAIYSHMSIKGDWQWLEGDTVFSSPGVYEMQARFIPDDITETPYETTIAVKVGKYVINCSDYTLSVTDVVAGHRLSGYALPTAYIFDDADERIEGTWQWVDKELSFSSPGVYETEAVFVPVNDKCYTSKFYAPVLITVVEASESTVSEGDKDQNNHGGADSNSEDSDNQSDVRLPNPDTGIHNTSVAVALAAAVASLATLAVIFGIRRRRRK